MSPRSPDGRSAAAECRTFTIGGFLSELEDKGFLAADEATPTSRGRPPKAGRPTDRSDESDDVLPRLLQFTQPLRQRFPAV